VAEVVALEPLGSETLLYCRTREGADLVVRTAERLAVRPDQTVGLEVDAAAAHLFDGGSGERIR
jgi:multiple sugar transport system ATP-binding protein